MTEILSAILIYAIVFLPALLASALFLFSLIRFRKAKNRPEIRKNRKSLLIASSVLLGVVAAAYAGIFILLSIALRNM